MIDVLIVPGTGSPRGDAITTTFSNALDQQRFAPSIVPYPATYGGLEAPYAESRALGRAALMRAIWRASNPVIIAGYSQGAGIAGSLAAEIGAGAHPDLEVYACALIADPLRPPGAGMPHRPPAPGYGIAGERPIYGLPTWWAAAPGDPITALPAGNPLRSIADLTEWWALGNPIAAARWGQDLVDKCRTGAFQRWWSLENWRTWNGAMNYARGYLFDGRHGAAYIDEGHVRDLAEIVGREFANA
ncbi:hypothetical protein ACWFRF_20735 [Nocardia sp. NPDC055165]